MRQLLLRLLGVATGIGLGGVAVGLWLGFQQATQLPAWYRSTPDQASLRAADIDSPEAVDRLRRNLLQSVQTQLSSTPSQPTQGAEKSVTLTPQQVNQLIATTLPATPEGKTLGRVVKGIHTEIKDETLISGLVVNTAALETASLPAPLRQHLAQALVKNPLLRGKDLYVGIQGKPRIEAGQLLLDQHTQFVLGNSTLSVLELSQMLGISEKQLTQPIPLRLGSLQVKNAIVHNQSIILSGPTTP